MSDPKPPRGKPFQRGTSGNPGGRPKSVVIVQELARQHTEAAIKTLADIAQNGESDAARVTAANSLIERGYGKAAMADKPITFHLPPIETTEDVAQAGRALMSQVASGEITPSEAGDVMKLFDGLARTIEISEIEKRLRALEQGTAK